MVKFNNILNGKGNFVFRKEKDTFKAELDGLKVERSRERTELRVWVAVLLVIVIPSALIGSFIFL